MTGWNPLDTAPKDGRRFLFGCSATEECTVARWDDDCWDTQEAPPVLPYDRWREIEAPVMTAEQWIRVLNVLRSIDHVLGMPSDPGVGGRGWKTSADRNAEFLRDPVGFFRRSGDMTRAVIWAEVQRRLAGVA